MSDYATFLFARPSFLEGIGRLVDFGGALDQYNTSLTPEQADIIAMRMDWEAVGEDLRHAIEQYEHEVGEQTCNDE